MQVLRNTRSGWGIIRVTRPVVARAVIASAEPLGFIGYFKGFKGGKEGEVKRGLLVSAKQSTWYRCQGALHFVSMTPVALATDSDAHTVGRKCLHSEADECVGLDGFMCWLYLIAAEANHSYTTLNKTLPMTDRRKLNSV